MNAAQHAAALQAPEKGTPDAPGPSPDPATSSAAPVWILAVLLALVPLVAGNLTMLGIGRHALLYDSVALPRLALTAILGSLAWVVWLVFALRDRRQVRLTVPWILLGALAIWAAISAAASPHWALAVLGQSERLEGVVTIAGYALLYGIGLQCARSMIDVRRIAVGLGTGATVAAVYGIVQWLGLDPANYAFESYGFDLKTAFATFGNPNFLAGLLVLVLPVLGALAITARRPTARASWWIAAASAGVALVATVTRGAWLAAGVELAIIGAIWGWRRSGSKRLKAWAPTALLVVLVLLAAVALLATVESSSARERLAVAGVAATATASRPILGCGPDAFLAAFRENRTADVVAQFGSSYTSNNAHSWPVQYAVTLGFPGAALLVAVLWLALWGSRRVAFPSADKTPAMLMVGIWVGCMGFVVHMLLSAAAIGATTPFWVLLGVLGAGTARRLEVRPGILKVAATVAPVAALGTLALSLCLLSADAAYVSSRLAFNGMGTGDPGALAASAVVYDPLSVKYSRGLAEVRANDVRAAMSRAASFEDVRSAYAVADEQLARTLTLDAADYAALAWRAALQAEVARYTGDRELAGTAVDTAKQAALLDRQASDVSRLASGDMSPASTLAAAMTPPLP